MTMTDTYFFGYGSLLNLASLGNTLKRPVTLPEVHVCRLTGYQRAWTYLTQSYSEHLGKVVDSVFLNLAKATGPGANGIVFKVSEEELAALKRRELHYQFIDVTQHIAPADSSSPPPPFPKVLTSLADAKHTAPEKAQGLYAFEVYRERVLGGVQAFGQAFTEAFHQSSQACPHTWLPGTYRDNVT